MTADRNAHPKPNVVLFYFEGPFEAFQAACESCDLTNPNDPMARALARLDGAMAAPQPNWVQVVLADGGGHV